MFTGCQVACGECLGHASEVDAEGRLGNHLKKKEVLIVWLDSYRGCIVINCLMEKLANIISIFSEKRFAEEWPGNNHGIDGCSRAIAIYLDNHIRTISSCCVKDGQHFRSFSPSSSGFNGCMSSLFKFFNRCLFVHSYFLSAADMSSTVLRVPLPTRSITDRILAASPLGPSILSATACAVRLLASSNRCRPAMSRIAVAA